MKNTRWNRMLRNVYGDEGVSQFGLPEDDPHRWDALATYNAERARGIMHTPEWQERMAREQEAFNTVYHQKP